MSPADDPDPRPTRRWFLAGGAAVVVGGGAGVGAGFLRTSSPRVARPAPAALVAAAAAETALLALASDAVGDPALRATADALITDHTAHLHALQAALSAYDRPRSSATGPTSAPAPAPAPASTTAVRARLRTAEQAAATSAAARATQVSGPVATLLAGISACESTHVELLT